MSKSSTPTTTSVLGIDIGHSKVVAAVLTQNEDGRIIVSGVGTCNRDLGNPGGESVDKLSVLIDRAIGLAQLKGKRNLDQIIVSNSGQQTIAERRSFSIPIENPDNLISLADVEELNRCAYNAFVAPDTFQVMHVLPIKYFTDVDSDVYEPVGTTSPTKILGCEFMVITNKRQVSSNVEKCLHKLGRTSTNHVHAALASSLAVLTSYEMDQGVLLLDIGATTLNFVVFVEGVIQYMSVFQYGSRLITSDIATTFGLNYVDAEVIQKNSSNAFFHREAKSPMVTLASKDNQHRNLNEHDISQVVNARWLELLGIIEAELDQSISSNLNDTVGKFIPAGIVLTGGGAKQRGLRELVESRLGRAVRIGHAQSHIDKVGATNQTNPENSVAIGLALSGFISIDPREERYKQTSLSNLSQQVSEGSSIGKAFGFASKVFNEFGRAISTEKLPDTY